MKLQPQEPALKTYQAERVLRLAGSCDGHCRFLAPLLFVYLLNPFLHDANGLVDPAWVLAHPLYFNDRMTSYRPLEEWGKLLCDVLTAGANIDRFLHHTWVTAITGKTYRVKEASAVS